MIRTNANPIAVAVLALPILTACETPSNTVRTTTGGQTVIEIRQGVNCYDGQCFSYDAARGLVAATGRRATTPPISLAGGTVTPEQFTATFNKAMRMDARGSGGSGRD